MHGFMVFLFSLAAVLFLPTTAQTNRPDCPKYPVDAARHCWVEPEQAAEDRVQAGSFIFLPTVQQVKPPPEEEQAAAAPAAAVAHAAEPEDTASAETAGIPVTSGERGTYHTVQPAETLEKIARTYDTPLEALVMANPQINNPALIYVGDRVLIPTAAEIERLVSEETLRRMEQQRQIVASTPHKGARWIDVDLQSQTVRAYEGDTLVNTFVASTGKARTPTVTGQYRIWIKLRTDDMSGPGYDLEDVPYVMYFHKGYGLHGTYWHNNFGTPTSHGCVNLRTDDAAWLYDFSSVGTLVNVH